MFRRSTTEIDGLPRRFDEGWVTLILPAMKLLSGEFVVPVWLLDDDAACTASTSRRRRENLMVQNRTKELGHLLHEHDWIRGTVDVRAGKPGGRDAEQ